MNEAIPLSQSESPTQFTHVQQQQQGQNAVACMICHAVYAPHANQPQLTQAPKTVLESALMAMCHFCFRCRRPSCPFCWDAVHGICGACVLETGLPFRSNVPPLSGTWLPPMRQGQPATNNGTAYPLVCIQPGRLEGLAVQPIQPVQPVLANRVAPGMNMMPPQAQSIPGALPGISPMFPQNAQPMSPVMMQPPPIAPMSPIPTIPRTPDTVQPTKMDVSKRAKPTKTMEEDHLAPYYIYIDDGEDVVVDGIDADTSSTMHPIRRFERAITLLLLVVIALLMIIVIAASFSSEVNSYIAQTIHIDIRAEITYLWQLLAQLLSR